jgi:hypothetical protein
MRVEYLPTLDALAQRKESGHWPMLRYHVTLLKEGKAHSFDYSAGIGHVKGLKTSGLTIYTQNILLDVYETGKLRKNSDSAAGKYIHFDSGKNAPLAFTPALVDVLYCLVSDADALNYTSFEEWADSFGYEKDSRSAEATYNACIENALKVRQLIDLDAAQIAFEDY